MEKSINSIIKFVVKTQISKSSHIELIVSILLQHGSLSLPQINELYIQQIQKSKNINPDHGKNNLLNEVSKKQIAQALTILIQQDLVKIKFSQKDFSYLYYFDKNQAILRLSISRFLFKIQDDIKRDILIQILTFGNLKKQQITQKLTEKGYNELEVQEKIAEMTLQEYLKGAQDLSKHMEIEKKINQDKNVDEATTQIKKQKKREIKGIEKKQIEELKFDSPLQINYNKLIHIEKKQFVLDFAKVKLSKVNPKNQFSCYSESTEFEVFKAIVEVCEGDQWSLVNLESGRKFSVEEIYIACQSQRINFHDDEQDSYNDNSLNEKQRNIKILSHILENLANDSSEFLKRTHSLSSQSGILYEVNWQQVLEYAQTAFLENIIENTSTQGVYTVRVLRILKKKGYLVESDIQKMSLLPPRDTRAVLNQLIADGYINHLQIQQVPSKLLGAQFASGQQNQAGQMQTMYGINLNTIKHKIQQKIAQTILNLLVRYGSLGKFNSITKEFNCLYF